MANRSYLFSSPAVPAPTGDLPSPIRGISEFNYAIPWVHKLLVSVNAALCPSAIWDKPVAIVGDYDAGVARLEAALEALRSAGQLEGQAGAQADKALAFVKQERSRQRYFLLEAGEVFALSGGDAEAEAKRLLAEVQRVEVSPASLPKDAGLDAFWSHVLYFSFKE